MVSFFGGFSTTEGDIIGGKETLNHGCAQQATARGLYPKFQQDKTLNHNVIHSETSHKLSKVYIFHRY